MKFSISWLKEHLDTTASVDEIAETLTKIGLEVEEVFNPASRLDGFVTAEVETYERHPDSDHLGLLTVNTGKEVAGRLWCAKLQTGAERHFCAGWRRYSVL